MEKQDIKSIGKRLALSILTFSPLFLMFIILSFFKGPVPPLAWSLIFFLVGFSGVIVVIRKEIPMSLHSIQGKSAVIQGSLFTILLWSAALYFLVDYLW